MIAGLILAAGESSRMGRDKASLPFRGSTFLETIIQTLREAGIARVAVVLGHHADEILESLQLKDIEVVINRDYHLGQTSSLQAGLRAVAAMSSSPQSTDQGGGGGDNAGTTGEPEAVLLCLVDHPAVSAATVRALADSFQQSPAPVIIPTHQGQRGHPVMIARKLFPELLSLGPVEGANTVIRKYRDTSKFLEIDDEGVLLDVDDPETFHRLDSV